MQALPRRRRDGRRRGRRGRGRCRCSPGAPTGSSLAAVNGPTSVVLSGDEEAVAALAGALRAAGPQGPSGCGSATRSTRRSWSRCWTSSAGSPPADLRPAADRRRLQPHRRAGRRRRAVRRRSTGSGTSAARCGSRDGVLALHEARRHPLPRARPGRRAHRHGRGLPGRRRGRPCVLRAAAGLRHRPARRPRRVPHPAGRAGATARRRRHRRLRRRVPPGTGRTDLPTYASSASATGWPLPHRGGRPRRRARREPSTRCWRGRRGAGGRRAAAHRPPARCATQPWLADHAVVGTVLLPGTAFVELALRAGDAGRLRPGRGTDPGGPAGAARARRAVQLQVARRRRRRGRTPAGHRLLPPGGRHRPGRRTGRPWLGTPPGRSPPRPRRRRHRAPPAAWPPAGAVPVDVAGLYERLADAGYRYGPAFQGLHAAWRPATRCSPRCALPRTARRLRPLRGCTRRCSTPPCTRRRVSPATTRPAAPPEPSGCRSPGDVRLHATGAAGLRVRLTPTGPDSVAMRACRRYRRAGRHGRLADAADRLRGPLAGRSAAVDNSLFRVDWQAFALPAEAPAAAGRWALVGSGDPGLADGLRSAATVTGHPGLAGLRASVAAGQQAPDLVVLTVPGASEGDGRRPGCAPPPIWYWRQLQELAGRRRAGRDAAGGRDRRRRRGRRRRRPRRPGRGRGLGLVRAAQAEHPDRFVLVDLDDDAASAGAGRRGVGRLRRRVSRSWRCAPARSWSPRLSGPPPARTLRRPRSTPTAPS